MVGHGIHQRGFFFFSSRRRHTRFDCDWSSDVCSSDLRPKVIAVECTIAGAFVLLAAAGVTGSAWLLVLGYTGHGLKDFWQEHSHYVASTRWWPPFCAAVDWLVAVVLIIEIVVGVGFHH